MKIHYSITKEQRKKVVEVVGKALEKQAVYCGAPTFSYRVGEVKITRDGSICGEDASEVERVRTALREAGFAAAEDAPEMPTAEADSDEDSLAVSRPRSSFTETALKIWTRCLQAKGI